MNGFQCPSPLFGDCLVSEGRAKSFNTITIYRPPNMSMIFSFRFSMILLGAELAQLVRWMTLNQEAPGSNLNTAI